MRITRRRLLMTATAAGLAPAGLALAAEPMLEYTPGLIQAALERGETVLVDYSAGWCSTCARQERVITALRSANPAYDGAITFVRVDWDDYRRHEVTTTRSIPRRSTLILLQGEAELGRIVAGTSEKQIKALMDLAL